jgi:dUTP pyrophosphatase
MSRTVYLAEAIDRAPELDRNLVEKIALVLSGQGWAVYRPWAAWYITTMDVSPQPELVNRQALELADAMIAYWPERVHSTGVPREIEMAVERGIPVLVIGRGRTWSLSDVDVLPEFESTDPIVAWLANVPEPDPQPSGMLDLIFTGPGPLPTRAHAGDAGFDLYVSEEKVIPPNEFVDVPCGVSLALPDDLWARITGRSSTLRRRGLLVAEGIIDAGYRGPLYAGVWNLTEDPVTLPVGDRVAQLLVAPNIAPMFRPILVGSDEFEAIPHDGRGTAGFGSTGS